MIRNAIIIILFASTVFAQDKVDSLIIEIDRLYAELNVIKNEMDNLRIEMFHDSTAIMPTVIKEYKRKQ